MKEELGREKMGLKEAQVARVNTFDIFKNFNYSLSLIAVFSPVLVCECKPPLLW